MKRTRGYVTLVLAGWLGHHVGECDSRAPPPSRSVRATPPEPTACTRVVCSVSATEWLEQPLPVGRAMATDGHLRWAWALHGTPAPAPATPAARPGRVHY